MTAIIVSRQQSKRNEDSNIERPLMDSNHTSVIKLNTTIKNAHIDYYSYLLAKDFCDDLPNFNGEGLNSVQNFEEFDREIRIFLSMITDDRQAIFCAKIIQRTYGRARDVLENIEIRTVQDILNALAKNIHYVRILQKRLLTVCIKEGELIEDFYYRLRSIIWGLKKYYSEKDRDYVLRQANQMAFDCFYEILPDYLKLCAIINHHTTLEDFYEEIKNEVIDRMPCSPRYHRIPESSRHPHGNHHCDGENYNRRAHYNYQRPGDYEDTKDYREKCSCPFCPGHN